MNKKQRRMLARILISAAMLILLGVLPRLIPFHWNQANFQARASRFVLYLIPYIVIGYDILLKAAKGVRNRQAFDENFLMAVATLGALAIAAYDDGDYVEAVAVMLFYQIGELFQSYAVGRSRRDISALMDIRPDYANIEHDNKLERVPPDEVAVGSVIIVQPGEKIPIDGIVTDGRSSLNTGALTGESAPRDVRTGDEVFSGCVNTGGVLKVRTTREFGESTASKILDLVENASSRKSRSENFISRFARVYTPAVCFCALALAVLPPLIRYFVIGVSPGWGEWLYRALTFLVISCPCALVISIPLSFFAGLGGAGREGILVKGSSYLEALSEADCVVMDKTGTLTEGSFEVSAVHPEQIDETQLLHLTAHVERYSTHPIANSLRKAYPHEADDCRVEEAEEIPGQGIRARVNGETVCVGNPGMMEAVGAKWHECYKNGTVIHAAIEGRYAGHVVISDVIKPDAKEAIDSLRAAGIHKMVMLTGDSASVAENVARELGIDEFYSELLPDGKVSKVEELLAEKRRGKLVFVGDGINDAPVLSRADVGIAMGVRGSDAAIEAADVVLMDDDPMKIVKAIRISRKCMRIVRQNTWFSIGIKLLCMALVTLGIANMWLAVFADVGVMVIAVLNAIRALFVHE